jgi:hypothetical protein
MSPISYFSIEPRQDNIELSGCQFAHGSRKPQQLARRHVCAEERKRQD